MIATYDAAVSPAANVIEATPARPEVTATAAPMAAQRERLTRRSRTREVDVSMMLFPIWLRQPSVDAWLILRADRCGRWSNRYSQARNSHVP